MEVSKIEKIIKKTIKYFLITCVYAVIAFILVRIWMGNYYPKTMKNIYFTENLTSYYTENAGDIEVLCQDINTPYDQWEGLGTFFSGNLIFIPEAGEVQFSLRCSDNIADIVLARYGHDVAYYDGMFTFELRDDKGNTYTPTYEGDDRKFFYNYTKLAFDGIDFDTVGQLIAVVHYAGGDDGEPFAELYVYENPEIYEYIRNKEYKLSKSERPE